MHSSEICLNIKTSFYPFITPVPSISNVYHPSIVQLTILLLTDNENINQSVLFTNLFPTGQRVVKSHQIASDRTYQRQTDSEYSLYVLLSLPQVQQPYPVQKTNDALIFMLPEANDIKFI